MSKKSASPRTKWSLSQLEAYIRQESVDSDHVVFLAHTLKRMRERRITREWALVTLRKGSIRLRPELDSHTGDIKCRMEYYVAGVNIKLVVAISDDDPNLIIVTAI